MYKLRECDSLILDQTCRLLPPEAMVNGTGTYDQRSEKKKTPEKGTLGGLSVEDWKAILHPPASAVAETGAASADGDLLDNILKLRQLKRMATEDGELEDAERYRKKIRRYELQLEMQSDSDEIED